MLGGGGEGVSSMLTCWGGGGRGCLTCSHVGGGGRGVSSMLTCWGEGGV